MGCGLGIKWGVGLALNGVLVWHYMGCGLGIKWSVGG